VEITLDAFGDEIVFGGYVDFIEPAETVIQEVIYYKVKSVFSKEDNNIAYYEKIKPGMTANVTIFTAKKDNVLLCPIRAVLEKTNDLGKRIKYSRVLEKGDVREVEVETGLRGDQGMVEILRGLEEGDEVITFIKEE
jgi:multidrug efflux pump subunit AcrA (membrane-fusion protein)